MKTGAILAALLTLGLVGGAHAQTASVSAGLGQAWPNTADVSTSPHWHVYVFQLNGVKYVQVNDLNGTVHAAVGTASGATIILPMGVDAQNVTTASVTSQAAETVYQDATTTVTATPQSSGATTFTVRALDTCPQLQCSGPGFSKAIQ
jgi:hypothetical protein